MYPRISDLINDLFGTHLLLPVQSFGFMMGVAFFFAAWTLMLELKRKEKQGLLQAVPKQITVGAPAGVTDLVTNGVIGFFIGFKLIEAILHYHDLAEDPQSFLLSSRGNLLGGLLMAAVMVFWKYRESEKQRLPKPEKKTVLVHPYEMIWDITVIAAVCGLLGAKIFDGIEHMDEFISDPLGVIFSFSGLAFYGGLIFGSIGVLWFARKNKIPLIHMVDSAAPGLILAYGIGRIGCHIAGDGDWGIVNTSPKPSWWIFPDWTWAFGYPHNVNGEGVHIPGCVGRFCYELIPPVFPTPLYEITVALLIFLLLWSIRKKITTPGTLFSIYLVLNGIERFLIEFIRVDIKYNVFGMVLTQAQMIAVGMFVLGIIGIIFTRRRRSYPSTSS